MARSAQTIDAELRGFVARSPFEDERALRGIQQLRAAMSDEEELLRTLKGIGDAISAVGGDTGAFLQALAAIRQIRLKGELAREEITQLAALGIPVRQILREELAGTPPRFELEGVPAEQAIEALARGCSRRYGGATELRGRSLSGTFSLLRDTLRPVWARIEGFVLRTLARAHR